MIASCLRIDPRQRATSEEVFFQLLWIADDATNGEDVSGPCGGSGGAKGGGGGGGVGSSSSTSNPLPSVAEQEEEEEEKEETSHDGDDSHDGGLGGAARLGALTECLSGARSVGAQKELRAKYSALGLLE